MNIYIEKKHSWSDNEWLISTSHSDPRTWLGSMNTAINNYCKYYEIDKNDYTWFKYNNKKDEYVEITRKSKSKGADKK